ncbi:hydrophobe/amphiphile efflux-1 family RND transporter [Paramagnetospirillum kuznetsovii]|uniref:Efflux pump membrane transporter n=1 Tax=Paramagnetospirillum kuznetsovii TaxID=2053833 RepID=A0A364NSR1_9PROT|nr:multidrug efflux RND transporter permease subunit [Paramagnetospirillum kuznetsovii]RAU20123.1 hydrophobe/amphiphile efflux-1 family RND transporter [Paramagnetospirillum kuznetsovii]
MRLAHFFIDRPIFATVVSILITIIGAITFFALPVAQYPEIAPPTIVVSAQYPGASAQVVADTVATPLEQQINGVENMLYINSQATGDGNLRMTVTFALGTNLDIAQVLVQNRVAIATARLPDDVKRIGVTVAKNSPDMLLVVHLNSPDGSRDQLYMSNFATLQLIDVLARLDGVGEVRVFGARDYAMRVWIDPDKAASRNLTAGEVVKALQAQNVQVAAGVLDQPPVPKQGAFQLSVQTQGRLKDPAQFGEVILKADPSGRVVRLKDIARIELGAQDYSVSGYLNGNNAVPVAVFQRPGSNALATAERILAKVEEMSKTFPSGVSYTIAYNPTKFIAQSVHEVIKTIFEAVVLVVVVVILFLQTWRASLIPVAAIPVSLVGTFAILGALGYSLNNLSLFGLVLAVGIVVDDAIVVVENVERNMREGMNSKSAAHQTMDEVGGALISIALVLCAVFIPAAFIPGISGQFFRQFAVTIAASTVISLIVSLTLSPALCALLFRGHGPNDHHDDTTWTRPFTLFFKGFNKGFDRLASGYGNLTRGVVRRSFIMLVIYAGLIGAAGLEFMKTPKGFIPDMDQGYLITVIQLPPGSSLSRTEAVVRRAAAIMAETPGVGHTVAFAGLDGATFTNASNGAAIFTPLKPFEERYAQGLSSTVITADLRKRLGAIQEAFIITIAPPPVRGIGTAGGFKMMLQDKGGRGSKALEDVAQDLAGAANKVPGLSGIFTLFNTRTPNIQADIDLARAQMLGVPADRVNEALQVYLGSAFVNEFNFLGRTFRVTAQADAQFRNEIEDIASIKVRNDKGQMVPLGAVASFRTDTGPYRIPRYNLFPAAEIQGSAAPGYASGYALEQMRVIAAEVMPEGFGFEWTELALQELLAGNNGLLVFAASVLFVFLLLAAQYESWSLPAAVVLIVPMCLLAAVSGLIIRGMSINILAQIGFIVLIGLAAKNAILIVEFARQAEGEGMDRIEAAVHAGRTRLRPILMTSLAFVLGVLPLVIASGAGAEMRQSLGTAVFFGMLGVTGFGLIFTPIFYVVIRKLVAGHHARAAAAHAKELARGH